MSHPIDITGMRFGRLVAVRRVGTTAANKAIWLCVCDCGGTAKAPTGGLRSGNTTSCGCAKVDHILKVRKPWTYRRPTGPQPALRQRHGKMNHPRLYECWLSMRQRCYYERYHGRRFYEGIEVCPAWNKHFSAFCEWALSHGYADDLTLERINSKLGYNPQNCEWITKSEQARRSTEVRLA